MIDLINSFVRLGFITCIGIASISNILIGISYIKTNKFREEFGINLVYSALFLFGASILVAILAELI